MSIFGMFGGSEYPTRRVEDETEIERLRRELTEARDEIERLRRALGPNHPLGRQRGFFG